MSNGEKINPSSIETNYSAEGLNVILVGNNQSKTGILVIPDEKMNSEIKNRGLEEVTNSILSFLSNSSKRFGIGFSSKNIAVLTDFDEHQELISGTMKTRRKLVENKYSELIKQICN